MGPNWHMNGMGWQWVFLVLLIIGIVLLTIALIRYLAPRSDRTEDRPSSIGRARELLDERYARGEIDSSEYDERRRRLDGMSGP